MMLELIVRPIVSVGVLVLVFIAAMALAHGLARWAKGTGPPPPIDEDPSHIAVSRPHEMREMP